MNELILKFLLEYVIIAGMRRDISRSFRPKLFIPSWNLKILS